MKKVVAIAFLTIVTCFIIHAQNTEIAGNSASEFSYQLIPSFNQTWGYNVYTNKKLTIHQPVIPGISGNEGFKTKEGASKVAELVIKKMKRGEMPPTITKEELQKLNAI